MDDALLVWLNQTLAHPLLDAVMPLASTVGLALCPAAGATLLVGRRRRLGAALLAALAVGLAMTLRSAGLDDLAADLAGMVMFWWLSRRVSGADAGELHHQGTKTRREWRRVAPRMRQPASAGVARSPVALAPGGGGGKRCHACTACRPQPAPRGHKRPRYERRSVNRASGMFTALVRHATGRRRGL